MGLTTAFRLVIVPNDAHWPCAFEVARDAYPHARRILALLQSNQIENMDRALTDALIRATQIMFPHDILSSDECADAPRLAGPASFYVGYAVCWLLLQTVNGGHGATAGNGRA